MISLYVFGVKFLGELMFRVWVAVSQLPIFFKVSEAEVIQ